MMTIPSGGLTLCVDSTLLVYKQTLAEGSSVFLSYTFYMIISHLSLSLVFIIISSW